MEHGTSLKNHIKRSVIWISHHKRFDKSHHDVYEYHIRFIHFNLFELFSEQVLYHLTTKRWNLNRKNRTRKICAGHADRDDGGSEQGSNTDTDTDTLDTSIFCNRISSIWCWHYKVFNTIKLMCKRVAKAMKVWRHVGHAFTCIVNIYIYDGI